MTLSQFASFVPVLTEATARTLALSIATIVLASAVGVLMAVGSAFGGRPLQVFLNSSSWVLRGIPALVLLLITFYGPSALHVQVDAFSSAVVGLTLSVCAYYMEVVRGGLAAIPKGQFEAAHALGLSSRRLATRIVVPQVARVVRAPYLAATTNLVKNTSLASVVTVPELMSTSRHLIEFSGHPFAILTAVALVYAVLNWMLLFAAGTGRGRPAPAAALDTGARA